MTESEIKTLLRLRSQCTPGHWMQRGLSVYSFDGADPKFEIANFDSVDQPPEWRRNREFFMYAADKAAALGQELLDLRAKLAAVEAECAEHKARAHVAEKDCGALRESHRQAQDKVLQTSQEDARNRAALREVEATLRWFMTYWDVGVQEQARNALRKMGHKVDP